MKERVSYDPDADERGEVRVIDVGVGELAVGKSPDRIVASALGSCVGVAVYDPVTGRGGMAHVMLPRASDTAVDGDPVRFADRAMPRLVEEICAQGSLKSRLVAKLAGGAAMFRGDSVAASIGERNAAEVKRQLGLLRIPVLAEDTGGSHARTVILDLRTGKVTVRSLAHGTRDL